MCRLVTASLLWIISFSSTSGLVTETSASNQPPFSFACEIAAGGQSSSFCSGNDRPIAKVEKVDIYIDYNNKVGECLDPDKGKLIDMLSKWFNNECKKAPTDREENIRLPIQDLQDNMTRHCNINHPIIIKIVVNYECVRDPGDTPQMSTVTPRPDGPTIATQPTASIPEPPPTTTVTKTTTTRQNPLPSPSSLLPEPGTTGGASGFAPTPTESGKGGSITTTELILAILIPVILLLILTGLILWYCFCYSRRSDERKDGAPSVLELSARKASRSSTAFLVPVSYKNAVNGDDQSGVFYDGSSVGNDYTQLPYDVTRRSIDARGGVGSDGGSGRVDDLSPVYATYNRPSQSSRGDVGIGDHYGTPPSTPYGYATSFSELGSGDGHSAALGGGRADFADAPTSRRSSSADAAQSGGFYDRRLSDRRLTMVRRPSETSVRSGSSLPRTSVVENRKLSLTSHAELPSDRRSSSGSVAAPPTVASGERKISFGSAAERRISDGLQQQWLPTSGGRRPTTYGGPGMPEIHEIHESPAGDSVFYSVASRSLGVSQDAADADAARRDGAPTPPPNSGHPGRTTFGGEIEVDTTSYSYWPAEWQSWLKSRPSAV